MRLVSGIARIVVVVVVVISVVVVGLVGALTARGLPRTSGTVRVTGLRGPVEIVRDRAGILNIVADDPHDLFLGQGYAHAQERMWQMEVSRRIGAGRLSELFGRSQLETDRFIRTLGWRQSAARDLEATDPAVRAVLDAYAEGVNAWIAEHDGSLSVPFVVAGLLSGEGGLGGFALEPWTALDTVTWQKVQAWSLGGNFDAEVFRLLADAALGDPARTDELFQPYDPDLPVILPDTGVPTTPTTAASGVAPAFDPDGDTAAALRGLAGIGRAVTALAGFDDADGLVGRRGVGSNDWVVGGARSASGSAILANDPHLGLAMPSVWIVNGLHCRVVSATCPWDVAGVSFPGAPLVILGHNARIAWGATNVGPDVQDLFVEAVDPANPANYLFRGESIPFQVRTETIAVAGAEPVTLTVRSTGHGPILNDVDDRLADGPLLALRWTTTAEVDVAFEAFYHLGLAAGFEDFRAAFEGYGAPSQNFVYADVEGHIGYQVPGLMPIRDGVPTGERVRDGASGDEEWTGYVPLGELPWAFDPAAGYVATANNAVVGAGYPYWLGRDWDPGYRAARIIAGIEALPPAGATAEAMRAIQMDDVVARADLIRPLLADLDPRPTSDDGRLLLERIAAWDGRCGVDSRGCPAYLAVEVDLTRALVDDELGWLAREWVGSTESWQSLIAFLRDPGGSWWDDVTTAGREAARDVAAAAIDRAGAELRAALGDPDRWTWGRLHTMTFRERTLGLSGIGPLEWYFNHPAFPVGGADGAVQNNYYRISRLYDDPFSDDDVPLGLGGVFSVTNGPSLRLTVDMADPDAGRVVITTGQSGNPFDRHYGDWADEWAKGGTFPLWFDLDSIRAAAVSTLRLTP